jgi:hypothetical protein
MSSHVYAVQLTPTWYELRVGDKTPEVITDKVTINFYDQVSRVVPSGSFDSNGWPKYEYKTSTKKSPYPLTQTYVKGGELLCTVRVFELRRVVERMKLACDKLERVRAFDEAASAKLMDPAFRQTYLPSAF